MNRRAAVGVVVGLLAAVGGWWISRQMGPSQATTTVTPVRPGSGGPASPAADGAPAYEIPETERARLHVLLQTLMTANQEDALWARSRLVEAGPEGRAIVIDMAREALQSNPPFAEHALEVLQVVPAPSDATFAIEALASRDPGVVTRAADLLGALGAASRDAVPALLRGVRAREPIPAHAAAALAKIGGPAAEDGLSEIALDEHAEIMSRRQSILALGSFRGARGRDALLHVRKNAPDPTTRFVAGQALVERGDPEPLPDLRDAFARMADGPSLILLAWANDPAALVEIQKRLQTPLESPERRLDALELLARFPAETQIPILRRTVDEAVEDDVRVDALDRLVRAGGEDPRAQLLGMLTSNAQGERARKDRGLAALVIGRIRDPSHAQPIMAALQQPGVDPELRIILLRALVLTGAPQGAETVVRAMAADTTGPHANFSLAMNLDEFLPTTPPAFRKAAGPYVLAALRGEMGALGVNARFAIVRAAGVCCGPEAAPLVESLLRDEEPIVRHAAAGALPGIAGPGTRRALEDAWSAQAGGADREAFRVALLRLSLLRPVR